MEAISALWDSGVFGGMATMVVTILGQLSAMNTQVYKRSGNATKTADRRPYRSRCRFQTLWRRRGMDSQNYACGSVRNVGSLPVHIRLFSGHSSSS